MRALGLALLVAGMTASPASAGVVIGDWNWSWLNACGGNGYATCMSGSIEYTDATKTIEVVVTNLNSSLLGFPDGGDVFTSVGLFNLPAAGIGVSCDNGGLTGWFCPSNGINGGGLGGNTLKYVSSVNGVGGGFGPAPGGVATLTQTFSFTFSTSLADYANSIGVGIHAQSGPAGCSTKMGVTSTGVVQNQDRQSYADCRDVSVPEPGSMALLATGLAGMALIRRRRSGADLVDENGDYVEL